MICRKSDWEPRLLQELAVRRTWSFVWGKHDCCLFAADMFETITGIDPVPHLRNKYKTAIEAYRLLRKVGTPTVEDAIVDVAKRFSVPETTQGFAKFGDHGVVKHNGLQMLAVVIDERVAIPGETALVFLPRSSLIRVWSV